MRTQTFFLLLFLLIFSAGAAAEDLQDLPEQTRQEIQRQARELGEAGASEEQAGQMLGAMAKNGFSRQNRDKAFDMVKDAAENNQPTSPIMDKAMEGIAKNAGEKNTITAMERVRNRNRLSKQLAEPLGMDNRQKKEAEEIIAGCLAAGMNRKDLSGLLQQTKGLNGQGRNREKTVLSVLQTARTMARKGTKSSDIYNSLRHAIQNRYSEKEIRMMGTSGSTQGFGTGGSGGSRGPGGSSGAGGNGPGGGGSAGAGGSGKGGGRGR